jgi:hypothetical protein
MPSFSRQWYVVIKTCTAGLNSSRLAAQGMYPTVIVVLVEMQKSLYDTDQVTCQRGFGTPSEIAFATREFSVTHGSSTMTRTTENLRQPGALGTTDDRV